jgi:hypothetical protein
MVVPAGNVTPVKVPEIFSTIAEKTVSVMQLMA